VYDAIMNMMPKQAQAHTGCVARCTLDTYRIDVYRTRVPLVAGLTTVSLSHTQADMVSEEEHYVYDGNNLVADVGGYLGLLLGASVMSLYDALVHLAYVTKGKKRSKNIKAVKK
jgi:hypothetical protein